MNQDERLKHILAHLKENGNIRIEQICENYSVSRDSARRDLVKLEEAQLIVRTHGGAILASPKLSTKPYEERLDNLGAKKRIGRAAAALIQDGETLFLNASTTVQAAVEACAGKDIYLTAVTNSIDTAAVLGKSPNAKVHLLGGQYNAWHRSVTGPQTVAMIRDFRAQTLLLGACAITPDGLSSPVLDETYVKREMIAMADRVIVLADSGKYQQSFLHHVCSLDKIDVLITDAEPPAAVKEVLVGNGVELIIALEGESHNEN
ncbi:transcriptional regulator, DeoR family [Paenibacillus curdlanolyticus YK9]|uniref:Transcriptional regulator, DeoR family n=1 Tax=Paenibacillus curdlanolyticus YK9 TaxID=717606 RepID=E0I9P2_9BACL|nr:DeoR/GlpR family DNA-binding transcription regulator [Paenibacillus curdlanolyticus]EFM11126.1 transcriptional regulator, DeoR family [Paenibacillus curdlanolyticus YK9]